MLYISNISAIGENLSEERFFPEPLSKDFYLIFSDRAHIIKLSSFLLLVCALPEKIKTKVLGREFEGGPFFKRVSLNNEHISYIKALQTSSLLNFKNGVFLT